MTIFPEKLSTRLIILLSVLFVLILSFIKINIQSDKTTSFISTSSPTSISMPTSFPTPTPIIRYFTNSRQSVLITIPKYMDISNEYETYEISFDQLLGSSRFYLTDDIFPRLVILDKNYEFSVLLTKEVVGDLAESNKAFTEVNTNQFGKLKKIAIDNGYKYFTDYYAVNLFPKNKNSTAFAYMSCQIIGEDWGECDKLISTLSIKLR